MTLTRISKVLAVFITVGSIAFVGFAIATTFGEPDPLRHLDNPVFNGYGISKQVGGDQWEAKRGFDGSSVGTSKVVYDVMVKVLNEVDQTRKQEATRLKEQQAALGAKNLSLQEFIIADENALKAYVETNRAYLAKIREAEAIATSQVISQTALAQSKELEAARRRNDVFRLKQQVEELKTDVFRLNELEVHLVNLLEQVQGDVQRTQARKQQLQTRLGY